jgi:hypothetical protein
MRRLTANQVELLSFVRAPAPATAADHGHIDFDQMLDAMSWQPSKQAAHFSIRALQKRGLLEKLPGLQLRRGRHRVCFRVTEAGLKALNGSVPEPSEPSLVDQSQPELPDPGVSLEVFED